MTTRTCVAAIVGFAVGFVQTANAGDGMAEGFSGAQWVSLGGDEGRGTNIWFCARKSFSLDAAPTKAVARIAAESQYWLWVNGNLAVYAGGLKRGPNPRDTYYDEIDLATFLKKGTNTVAALVWYWGKHGFSYNCSGRAGFLFDMDADGRRVASDATWKLLRHPAYGDTGKPHPEMILR